MRNFRTADELRKTIREIERQKPLPLIYKEVRLDVVRLEFMISKKVIIEIKSSNTNLLRLLGGKVSLLIHFNMLKLMNRLKRVVNNYQLCSSLAKPLELR